jgi:pyruvate dehydrogenase E1 component beta subunit
MRPVVELMFSDFMAVCWDQIINEAAKMHFMYAGRINVPMVIRTASGAGTGASSQHSQSLENMYCHVPGLKVVVPSTPADAKGLFKSAVRDNNPVIFLEHKLLYGEKGEVPEEEYTIPLGRADIKRQGTDVSFISYGRMVSECMKAAKLLEAKGISAEVLDLRTLSPLDTGAVLDSVRKTGRAVVVHEAVQFAGFGGEISALIMEHAFGDLKAPVRRVGAAYCPVPGAAAMEAAVLPDAERVAETAAGLFI